MMLRVRLALAAGLAATLVTLGLVLSRSPPALVGDNGIPPGRRVSSTLGDEVRCQSGGTVPRGTVAIRVSLAANAGPEVSVRVSSGSKVMSEGERDAGWGTDETVTVPVRRVSETIRDGHVCLAIGPAAEPIQVNGALGPSGVLLRMEYLRRGSRSWLSLAGAIARSMGIGHAPGGTWVVFLLIAVMVAIYVLAACVLLVKVR